MPQQVRIESKSRVWEWEGELITSFTTHGPETLRWVELELWELASGGILVHRIGQSVVYHTPDTRCTLRTGHQRGEPGTVDDLRDDADPCEFCMPPWPEDLDDKQPIRVEYPRHTINRVRDADEATLKLTTANVHGPRGIERQTVWSEPVKALLSQAAQARPDLFSEPVERIA